MEGVWDDFKKCVYSDLITKHFKSLYQNKFNNLRSKFYVNSFLSAFFSVIIVHAKFTLTLYKNNTDNSNILYL